MRGLRRGKKGESPPPEDPGAGGDPAPEGSGEGRQPGGAPGRDARGARRTSARRQRPPAGPRPSSPARRLGEALRQGGRATRERLAGTSGSLPGRALGVAGALAAIFFELLGGVLRLLFALAVVAAGWLGGPVRRAERAIAAASRALTPARALLVAAAGCAVLLALSQFADYRGIAVGVEQFEGIEVVAPAPQVERAEAGSAHGYAFVPAGIAALAILALATATGRWQLCRLVALVGIAAIVVGLGVDWPEGLSEGTVARDFAGAEARLLGGFWLQLTAGAGLAATSLLLAAELRRSAPARRRVRGGGERRRATGGPSASTTTGTAEA